jgi:DNA (cytosine-5)-methyltransferase 1
MIVTPDLRDAERLQGFPADWTAPAESVGRRGYRWQLIGNAVSVPVAQWIGQRLKRPRKYDPTGDRPLSAHERWPFAAWGGPDDRAYASEAGPWPVWHKRPSLLEFLHYPTQPLSARAASGFLKRTMRGTLRFPEGFLDDVRVHAETQLREAA